MSRPMVGWSGHKKRDQRTPLVYFKVQFSEHVYKTCNAGGDRNLEATPEAKIRYFGTKLKSVTLARSLHAVLFFYAAAGQYRKSVSIVLCLRGFSYQLLL